MAFTLLINGTDRSTYVKSRPEPTWRLPIRGQRGDSTFTLQVATADAFVPAARQRVEWRDNGNTVWTGTIDRVSVTHEAPLLTSRWYAVTAVSEEQRLDKLFVTRSFATGTTCGTIFSSILSTEAASEGIAAGTIQSGATLTEPLVFEQTRISDAFTDLQRRSGDFVWYIVDQTLYFEARSTTTAPFTVQDGASANMLATPQPKRQYDRSNYRNRQHLRLQERYLPPYRKIFVGDGTTFSFSVDQAIRDLISVTLTTATRSTATGTFSGLPSDGDTITIGTTIYTFRSSAAASAFNRSNSVLIGATAAATATNFVNAINDTGTGRGSTYGYPCKQHPAVYASSSGGTITLQTGYVGDWTANTALSESASNFTWSTSIMSGGTNGVDTAQTFSSTIGQANNSQWTYDVGGTAVAQTQGQTPPGSSTLIVIVYRPVGFGVLTVEDSADVATVATAETGSGVYENLMQRSDLKSYSDAVTFGGKILDALMTVNETVTWDTDTYGLFPGQLATISCTRLNISGTYMIQTVQGRFIGTQSGRLHFRYGITAQSATHGTTFMDFWVPLAEQGTLSNPTSITTGNTTINSPPSGGSPTWDNDTRGQIASFGFVDDTVGENTSLKYAPVHRSGTPFRGYLTWKTGAPLSSPYVPAPSKFDVLYSADGGFTWISIFGTSALTGTNLTVDSVINTDVTPDGYTPVSSDVGKIIRITGGTGFTAGYYEVLSLQSGKWRLNASPAAVSVAGGLWREALGFTILSDLISSFSHSMALYGWDNITLTTGQILRGDCLKSGGMEDILLTVEWQPQGNSGTGASLQLGGSGAGQSFFLTSMA